MPLAARFSSKNAHIIETNNVNAPDELDDAANQEDYPQTGNASQNQSGGDLDDSELETDDDDENPDTLDEDSDGSAIDTDGNGGMADEPDGVREGAE